MKIKIHNEKIAELELDYQQFIIDSIKGDVMQSFMEHSKITKELMIGSKDSLKELVWFGTDWGELFTQMSQKPQRKIKFHLLDVDFEGLDVYTPGPASCDSIEGLVLKTTDEKINKKIYIVGNTVVRIDAQISFALAQEIIDFGEVSWKFN